MRIMVAYTAKKVVVRANEKILFRIACALQQPVYMEDVALTTDYKEGILSVIEEIITQECDIDFIENQTGKIVKILYHCFE